MTKRILIVDDEIDFLFMTKATLEMTGLFRVRAVHLASQVRGVAREFKPDLILLDCMMPCEDGGTLASMFQADAALRDTPLAFLTATVSEPQVLASRCYSGVRTYLPKSIGLQALVDFIEAETGGGGGAPPGTPPGGGPVASAEA